MHIALIGASGNVGLPVLKELLERNHSVTAISRHPEKITIRHANLNLLKGDILNEPILPMIEGHEAVISTYNPGWKNPNIYNEYMQGATAILDAVIQAKINRFLMVGGAGSLEIAPGVQLIDTGQIPEEWKPGPLAARDFFNILKMETAVNWTFLSPAIMLQPGPRTGIYRRGTDQPVFNAQGECKISVADLAVALVDELERPQFIKKRFTVGY